LDEEDERGTHLVCAVVVVAGAILRDLLLCAALGHPEAGSRGVEERRGERAATSASRPRPHLAQCLAGQRGSRALVQTHLVPACSSEPCPVRRSAPLPPPRPPRSDPRSQHSRYPVELLYTCAASILLVRTLQSTAPRPAKPEPAAPSLLLPRRPLACLLALLTLRSGPPRLVQQLPYSERRPRRVALAPDAAAKLLQRCIDARLALFARGRTAAARPAAGPRPFSRSHTVELVLLRVHLARSTSGSGACSPARIVRMPRERGVDTCEHSESISASFRDSIMQWEGESDAPYTGPPARILGCPAAAAAPSPPLVPPMSACAARRGSALGAILPSPGTSARLAAVRGRAARGPCAGRADGARPSWTSGEVGWYGGGGVGVLREADDDEEDEEGTRAGGGTAM